MASLATPFVKKFDLAGPLMLAPLGGGPSTPTLVASAAEAGAFAVFGAAYLAPDALARDLDEIKSRTRRPFGVNLFVPADEPKITADEVARAVEATSAYRTELGLTHPPEVVPPYAENFASQFEAVLRARPAFFSFVFGRLARTHIEACRREGILVYGTCTSLEEGCALEADGCDGVIAQGIEAGGHRGLFTPLTPDPHVATLALTRVLARRLKIPVIASGGIMDGRGIVAAIDAGAQMAALGTAFLLCEEAGTNKSYREALRGAAGPTQLTRAFSGRWARGLENRFMHEMAGRPEAVLPFPAQNYFTRDIRKAAALAGRAEFLSLWAGMGVAQVREMKAAVLIRTLLEEARVAGG